MIRRGRSEKLISHTCIVFRKLPVRFPEFLSSVTYILECNMSPGICWQV